jgi:hypothetical protein
MWSRNGRVKVEITQEHIDEALARNSSHCTVALAVAAAIPDAKHIAIDLQTIRFTRRSNGKLLRYVFLTPHLARDIIIATDQGWRDQIKPVVLNMRPAQISRAGKRTGDTPDNAELRGSGLTVNKRQPHIGAHTDRITASGERNLSPDREDGLARRAPHLHENNRGLAPPLPPPRQARAARAMVSHASKGSVPTTLGGRLPPVSVLSRREFGLRVLRK